MTDAELKALAAKAKAEGFYISGGVSFPRELIERCPTPEAIEMGLAAAEEVEELSRNAKPKPRPAARIAAAWAPVIARMNARAANSSMSTA